MTQAGQLNEGDRTGTLLKGKWHLDALLGQGGTGEVYAATHRNGSRAAIKILRPTLASHVAIRTRFLREGYVANAVDHPGAVRVLDDDETDEGLVFLVMELLEGQTLDRRADGHGGRLPVDEVLEAAEHTLSVLEAAHAKAILHRDLKPENLFLTAARQLKVLDFGLARLRGPASTAERSHTVGGWTMGTPGYMPPEQVRGDWARVDATSELWSLGATMFALLTGAAVHDDPDSSRQMALTASRPVPSLAVAAPGMPAQVVALVDRALSFDKAGRFPTATVMKSAVVEVRRLFAPPPSPRHGPAAGQPTQPEAQALAGLPSSGVRPLAEPAVGQLVAVDAPEPADALGVATQRGPCPASVPTRKHPSSPAAASRPTPGSPRRSPPMPVTQHATPELLSPVEIAPDTYWVGKRDPSAIFHANPYLRVYRGARPDGASAQYSMLIDPGSSSDFAVVSAKVSQVLGGMGRLSALFINHQDPDVGSSAQVISARYAPQAAILCSEATWRLVMHLNLPRERFVDTDKYPNGCRLPTGHVVVPVPSPFCHFRGAVMLYDPATRVLFSGDLFGGLTAAGAKGLWADESDWTGVRAFHQTYMPTQRAIARVIERIRALTPSVEIIAPQHGRLLRGAVLGRFLDRLASLPVGLDVMEEGDGGPDVIAAWNSVMRRVFATAKMLLGPEAAERLAANDVLRDTLSIDGDGIEVLSLGRWTVGTAVGALAAGQPPEVANPIKLEAILAAEQLELPSPDLHIDDAEGSEGALAMG